MANDEPVIAEFHEIYEMMRHYSNTQQSMFKTFLSVYLAVWGGYILISHYNLQELSDPMLLFGFLANLLFLAMLISNRTYMVVMLRKLDFLRHRFLLTEPQAWIGYPQFYPKDEGKPLSSETARVWRVWSGFGFRVGLICFGNAVFFFLMEVPFSVPKIARFKYLLSFLVFVLLFLASYIFARYKEKTTVGYASVKQTRVEQE